MKPMIDSLNTLAKPVPITPEKDTTLLNLITNNLNKTIESAALAIENDKVGTTRRERREKNLKNESSKSIQKQSIRQKKM